MTICLTSTSHLLRPPLVSLLPYSLALTRPWLFLLERFLPYCRFGPLYLYSLDLKLRLAWPSPPTEEEVEGGPAVRITQYTTYSPAVVEAVVRAAAPQAYNGNRLYFGVNAYHPPDAGEDAKLSVIIIPPIEGGWAVALISHKQGWGRVIAAPPVFLPTPTSIAPAPAAGDNAGSSSAPPTNPGVSAGSFATGPLAARLSRACPGLDFHRIPLGGVPALAEENAGVWACALALWLIRWP